jgi:hypothetical protein
VLLLTVSSLPLHPDFVVLNVSVPPLTVSEGDDGENTTARVCFTATLNQPRSRNSVFELTVSSLSTATLGVDFVVPLVVVPADFQGEVYMACVNITIIGDDEVEADEMVVFVVVALTQDNIVVSADGSNFVEMTIIDNDGKLNV